MGSGTAVKVDNYGTITGQIVQSGSTAAPRTGARLVNHEDGTINAGQQLGLDVFQNDGQLFISGEGQVGSTFLSGNYLQTASGTLTIDLLGGDGSIVPRSDVFTIGEVAIFDPDSLIELLLPAGAKGGLFGDYDLVLASSFDFGGVDLVDLFNFPDLGGARFDANLVEVADGFAVRVSVAAVPLPPTWVLFGSTFVLMALRRFWLDRARSGSGSARVPRSYQASL